VKKTILCLLALLLLLLCGCTESEIACGVDAENRAYLRYDWELDLRELNVREQVPILSWLRERAGELEAKGFTVEHNAVAVTQQLTYLRAELTRQGADRAEAFALLRDMLTDESLTPFTAVVCEELPQELQECYRICLRLEPDRVLATAGTERWPKRLREQIEPWLEAGSIRLRLSLPCTELPEGESAETEDGLAVKTLTVPLTGNGELALSTLYYTGGGDNAQVWWKGEPRTAENAAALEQTMNRENAELKRYEKLLFPAAIALAALALLFFAWGTARSLRRKRRQREEAALSEVPVSQEISDEGRRGAYQAPADDPEPAADAPDAPVGDGSPVPPDPAAIIGGADAPTAIVLSADDANTSEEGRRGAYQAPAEAPDPSDDPEAPDLAPKNES
jgi:hypothetical protein